LPAPSPASAKAQLFGPKGHFAQAHARCMVDGVGNGGGGGQRGHTVQRQIALADGSDIAARMLRQIGTGPGDHIETGSGSDGTSPVVEGGGRAQQPARIGQQRRVLLHDFGPRAGRLGRLQCDCHGRPPHGSPRSRR
jgi:hypothetical protein